MSHTARAISQANIGIVNAILHSELSDFASALEQIYEIFCIIRHNFDIKPGSLSCYKLSLSNVLPASLWRSMLNELRRVRTIQKDVREQERSSVGWNRRYFVCRHNCSQSLDDSCIFTTALQHISSGTD